MLLYQNITSYIIIYKKKITLWSNEVTCYLPIATPVDFNLHMWVSVNLTNKVFYRQIRYMRFKLCLH